MDAMAREYDPRGVRFLAVVSHGDEEAMQSMVTVFRPSLGVFSDPQGELASRLGVKQFPYALVLDRLGQLRYQAPVKGIELLAQIVESLLTK